MQIFSFKRGVTLGAFQRVFLSCGGCLALATISVPNAHAFGPDYEVEFMPFVGKNLPYDLWGTPGTLSVLGLRSSMRLPNPSAALEASGFFQHAGSDKAYSLEAAFRHEVYSNFLNGYFSIGFHFSRFSLEPDRDSSGDCVLPGCLTDTGNHYGLTYGAGIFLPLGEWPIKLGARFYQNPQTWLLLEIGYGIRF